MRKIILTPSIVILVLAATSSADEIECGRNGNRQTFTGGETHGPAFSQESGDAALAKIYDVMFDDDCDQPCDEQEGFTVSGCEQGYGWVGGIGPAEDAKLLPNVEPPTWVANVFTDGGGNTGWVTCSNCEYTEVDEI